MVSFDSTENLIINIFSQILLKPGNKFQGRSQLVIDHDSAIHTFFTRQMHGHLTLFLRLFFWCGHSFRHFLELELVAGLHDVYVALQILDTDPQLDKVSLSLNILVLQFL